MHDPRTKKHSIPTSGSDSLLPRSLAGGGTAARRLFRGINRRLISTRRRRPIACAREEDAEALCRVSLVVGTHSHVPTADAQILPGGTAYQTDAGMCGDYNSVIGMDKDEPLNRFVTRIPSGRFQPALGPATLCGVFIETDASGLAKRVEPVRIGGRLKQVLPEV